MSSNQAIPHVDKYSLIDTLNIHPINSGGMCRARSILDSVNKVVCNQMRKKFPQFKMRPTEPLVLQGSVADGTKVSKPDEFDLLIPMDLCDKCWTFVETSSSTSELYHISRRDPCDQELLTSSSRTLLYCRQSLCTCKHLESVDDDLCCEGSIHRISAERVYEGTFSSLNELVHCVDWTSESFRILFVDNRAGPAITMKVLYKSEDFLDEPDCLLNIDYVPAVCIGGRFLVSTTCISVYGSRESNTAETYRWLNILGYSSRYWRQSFFLDELRMMTEIRTEAPTLFQMYRSFKALLADLNQWKYLDEENELDEEGSLTYSDSDEENISEEEESATISDSNEENETKEERSLITIPDSDEENESKEAGSLTSSDSDKGHKLKEEGELNISDQRIKSRLHSYSERSHLAKYLHGCPMHNVTEIISLSSVFLKTLLFNLWDRKELRGADEQTLATEYIGSLNECVTNKFFKNYFTGDELGGDFWYKGT